MVVVVVASVDSDARETCCAIKLIINHNLSTKIILKEIVHAYIYFIRLTFLSRLRVKDISIPCVCYLFNNYNISFIFFLISTVNKRNIIKLVKKKRSFMIDWRHEFAIGNIE